MKPIWYLAGPMSGLPDQNYPAFQAACDSLRSLGHTIVSPHETVHHPTEPDVDKWQALLRADAAVMLSCTGIILLPGWSKSKGARFEVSVALTLGMDVRYYLPPAGMIDIG